MATPRIPDEEYALRIKKAAAIAAERGLDALVFTSTESDFANVRYFTGYYTLWERSGVAISATGEAAMIVGPEAYATASDYSRVKNIFSLTCYRESANPDYPEVDVATFRDVMKSIGVTGDHIRVGMGSFLDTNIEIYKAMEAAYPEGEIVRADDIPTLLRKKKSENELACLRAAYDISEKTLNKVLEEMRPGMTESNIAGLAIRYMYEFGAEDQGMVQYVLSDESTRHALSRAYPHRIITKDSFVQLDLAARVDGYASALAVPVAMSKYTDEQRRCVEFGREVHEWVKTQVKEGVIASDIAKKTIQLYKDRGFGDNYLYGPLHGLGMIEVEAPWVETSTDYKLEENFCYQVDTFIIAEKFGLRWEEGIRVTKDGYEQFNPTPVCNRLYELGF